MAVAFERLHEYLLDRGLLLVEEIVEGHYAALEASRRNWNFQVSCRQRGLFVKQPRLGQINAATTLDREAKLYAAILRLPENARVRELLPRLVDFDSDHSLLVTELIGGMTSLHRVRWKDPKWMTRVAERIGAVLGVIHRELTAAIVAGDLPQFPAASPWILDAHRLTSDWSQVSGGTRAFLSALRHYEELSATLDALRSLWCPVSMIHSDIKWDNWLISDALDLRLVDWELAGIGDPAWDAAAVIASLLADWVACETSPARVRVSWENLAGPLQAFGAAYTKELPHDASLMTRSVSFARGRLIHLAYEYAQTLGDLDAYAAGLLQVAANLNQDSSSVQSLLMGRHA